MTIWVVGLAFARKPDAPPPPDPASIARAEEEAACSPPTVENYQFHTGFATDTVQAVAMDGAERAARAAAFETLCSGKSATRCEVLARHVEQWKKHWNPVTGHACAHVAVRRDYLDDDRGDQKRMSAELERLGDELAAKVGTDPLWIEAPTWSQSGCHAGPAGAAMVAELKNALAGTEVRLAGPAEPADRAHLSLDLRGTDVVIGATLAEKGRSGVVPLAGFSVPADLFNLKEAGGDCWFDRELGLVAGQRPGPDGRVVRVTVDGEGAYCEGDKLEPRVVVDRPSTVRVYSVARDGAAYLVWPPAGEEGRVDGSVSLGELVALRSTTPGDEKLVAVAGSVGAKLGPGTGFCKVPAALTSGVWPSSSAVGATTFQVLEATAAGCVRRGVPARPPTLPPEVAVCK